MAEIEKVEYEFPDEKEAREAKEAQKEVQIEAQKDAQQIKAQTAPQPTEPTVPAGQPPESSI